MRDAEWASSECMYVHELLLMALSSGVPRISSGVGSKDFLRGGKGANHAHQRKSSASRRHGDNVGGAKLCKSVRAPDNSGRDMLDATVHT